MLMLGGYCLGRVEIMNCVVIAAVNVDVNVNVSEETIRDIIECG